MRKFRKGEHVCIKPEAMPPGAECEGTIVKLSPDRRVAMVRINDEVEILIETQYLKEQPYHEK